VCLAARNKGPVSTTWAATAKGRFGGIAGSFLVAELTRLQMSFSQMFSVVGRKSTYPFAVPCVQDSKPVGGDRAVLCEMPVTASSRAMIFAWYRGWY